MGDKMTLTKLTIMGLLLAIVGLLHQTMPWQFWLIFHTSNYKLTPKFRTRVKDICHPSLGTCIYMYSIGLFPSPSILSENTHNSPSGPWDIPFFIRSPLWRATSDAGPVRIFFQRSRPNFEPHGCKLQRF